MRYQDILAGLRDAFPQPVSAPFHDSYVAHTVLRALDGLDDLKNDTPLLGHREDLDYDTARATTLAEEGEPLEAVVAELVSYFEGFTIWGHPHTQQNVIPPATIPSVVGMTLAHMYNPNIVSDEYSHRVAVAEVEVVAACSSLLGYTPHQAGGLFTFGGTATNLYGVKVGLEKAQPGAMNTGTRDELVTFASDRSHYCRITVAGWLGIGTDNSIAVPTNNRSEMDVGALRSAMEQAISAGKKIAAVICTIGTTDAFGIDDLEAVVRTRDELVEKHSLSYKPHVHADAVSGWAWSVFNDYDFEANPLGFKPLTIRALSDASHRIKALSMADSVGVDFHKTGFTPYICSLILFKDGRDLQLLGREPETMPMLYQHGDYHPGLYTLETSRMGGSALAALANLRLFGKQGWRAVLGHLIDLSQHLREQLAGQPRIRVLNRESLGIVTLFRAYPDGVDTFDIEERELSDPAMREEVRAHNEYNRRVADYLHDRAMHGLGVAISRTEAYQETHYGEPVLALKSYLVSPFDDEASVELVVQNVLQARQALAQED
ncbi:pyridoxal phosphate-dependent decarboxylase family protein [Streptomyces marianii]|uniref:Aspartate aminotransferase family protein n=1 Tax=Streptomyces marianii TaxID=1817406 RepID=A0A5R9EEF6_9ACTN|nr:pyridoxal-dependent decarboxylase [Streptomyces marianii]TLQ48650.1 aspartate aminotransferase family protein [Streptomyces marianii]